MYSHVLVPIKFEHNVLVQQYRDRKPSQALRLLLISDVHLFYVVEPLVECMDSTEEFQNCHHIDISPLVVGSTRDATAVVTCLLR